MLANTPFSLALIGRKPLKSHSCRRALKGDVLSLNHLKTTSLMTGGEKWCLSLDWLRLKKFHVARLLLSFEKGVEFERRCTPDPSVEEAGLLPFEEGHEADPLLLLEELHEAWLHEVELQLLWDGGCR